MSEEQLPRASNASDRLETLIAWERGQRDSATVYLREPADFYLTRKILAGSDIALEGVPCVGKTTLARDLAAMLVAQKSRVTVDFEDRDEALLNLYFRDPEGFALPFQLVKLLSRQARNEARRYERVASSIAAADVHFVHHILDRTLPGDMAFAFYQYVVGNFNYEQLQIYLQYATRSRSHFVKPDVLIYLTAPASVLVARVAKRGNADEMKLYNTEYFRVMDVCYRLALDYCGCIYVEIDNSAHFDDAVVPPAHCMHVLEKALMGMHDKSLRRLHEIHDDELVETITRLQSIHAEDAFLKEELAKPIGVHVAKKKEDT